MSPSPSSATSISPRVPPLSAVCRRLPPQRVTASPSSPSMASVVARPFFPAQIQPQAASARSIPQLLLGPALASWAAESRRWGSSGCGVWRRCRCCGDSHESEMDLALLVSDFVDGGSGDSLDSSDYESGLSDLTDMISAAELLCCAWRCRPPASYACRRHRIRTGPGSRGAEVDESARAAEFGPTSSSKDSHQKHEADKVDFCTSCSCFECFPSACKSFL